MPVYFIRVGESGPVKIGYSGDVPGRLQGLQTAHIETLHVLRVVGGNQATERWLHRHFTALRLTGEWFRFDPEMLAVEMPEPDEPVPPAPKKERLQLVSWAADVCSVKNPCEQCQARPLYRPARWGKRRQPLVAS